MRALGAARTTTPDGSADRRPARRIERTARGYTRALCARGGIGRRARLRALWASRPVVVRVHSSACRKPRERGVFLWSKHRLPMFAGPPLDHSDITPTERYYGHLERRIFAAGAIATEQAPETAGPQRRTRLNVSANTSRSRAVLPRGGSPLLGTVARQRANLLRSRSASRTLASISTFRIETDSTLIPNGTRMWRQKDMSSSAVASDCSSDVSRVSLA